jgi:hypothetical protein
LAIYFCSNEHGGEIIVRALVFKPINAASHIKLRPFLSQRGDFDAAQRPFAVAATVYKERTDVPRRPPQPDPD